jgi:hypothetical protein
LAGIALSLRLADADDGGEAGAPRRFGLLSHQGVALAVIGAPFGVPDDDGAGAGIRQYFGRNIAGMGSRRLGMAILRPDREVFRAARLLGERRDQRGRRADQKISLGGDSGGARQHGLEFGRGGLEAVHFPVAGNQRPDGVGHIRVSCRILMPDSASRARRPVPDGGYVASKPPAASIGPPRQGCDGAAATL